MMTIENEEDVHPKLCSHARDYCEKIGAESIYNIMCLGEGDYRIMYWILNEDKRKMEAIILRLPEELC